MKYDVTTMFPLSVYSAMIEEHQQWKKVFMNNVYGDYQYDRHDSDGDYNVVSEHCGHPVIHCDERMADFFKLISNHVKNYCISTLGMKDIFEVCMVKSWISRSQENNENLPVHVHSATHVSFVYYMNVPVDSNALVFSVKNHQNEVFQGVFNVDGVDTWMNEYTLHSTPQYQITPEEGKLVIFPSSAPHFTDPVNQTPQNFQTERLAISGDCILVLKEDEPMKHSNGYIHPKNWCVY
tara:strand:- start:2899 stop:3609 length:711 start_codon:yes stop_codon:yes gene_type:complete